VILADTSTTFIITIPEVVIWRKAADLARTFQRTGEDIRELVFDDLAAQALVRDLRAQACELVLGNHEIAWEVPGISGDLEVHCSFEHERDAVAFRLAIT
jgi:hypothetical protein